MKGRVNHSWSPETVDRLTQPREVPMTGPRRRVVASAPHLVEVVTEPQPELRPGEALVRMVASGVCGSDLAGVRGEHALS